MKRKNILCYSLFVLIALPFLTLAEKVKDIGGVISLVKGLFGSVLPLIMTLAVFYFLWTLANYVRKAGEEQAEARQQMIWGIIILFVMVSLWGIVNILRATLFG
jgi:hypothetical protein